MIQYYVMSGNVYDGPYATAEKAMEFLKRLAVKEFTTPELLNSVVIFCDSEKNC